MTIVGLLLVIFAFHVSLSFGFIALFVSIFVIGGSLGNLLAPVAFKPYASSSASTRRSDETQTSTSAPSLQRIMAR